MSISVYPRMFCPRFSVVSSNPTSMRDTIFTFIYSSQFKKLDLGTINHFMDGLEFLLNFFTRLHPQGKGGPFGALVWKTFKSLRSETSDQRHMDLIVSKTVKNVIL